MTNAQARIVLREVAEATDGWQTAARRNGIAQAELTRFEPALSQAINTVRSG